MFVGGGRFYESMANRTIDGGRGGEPLDYVNDFNLVSLTSYHRRV